MAKKSNFEKIVNTVNEISLIAKKRGIVHLYTQDYFLDGRFVTLNTKKLVNFGSCSYLGLETDKRLKESAIDAVNRFGSQFSSSRSYVSCGSYAELEYLLGEIFNAHILVSPNTSMGHGATLPVIIGSNDIVIFDQQAHYSMQEVIARLVYHGTDISILRHSNIDELAKKIEEYKQRYHKIWYVVDGVYSMYGDFAPFDKILPLLKKNRQFNLYVDDAHGMSWQGKNGSGYSLSKIDLNSQIVVATSLAKGFGSCGGVFIFKDKEIRDKIRFAGGSLLHSGPQQPATIGASIASAKIHLSNGRYKKLRY